MKRMLDELRELNNEEDYSVPADFKAKVIYRINERKSISKLKYIIPSCSVAAAVIIAAVVVSTGKINFESGQRDELEINELYAQNDETTDDFLFDASNLSMSTEETAYGDMTAAIESQNSIALNNEKKMASSSEYYDEIVNMLKINNFEVEKTANGVKVKGKLEDVKLVLFYFEEQLDFTEDGEYVIIKEK